MKNAIISLIIFAQLIMAGYIFGFAGQLYGQQFQERSALYEQILNLK
jgi:hypothetical protein